MVVHKRVVAVHKLVLVAAELASLVPLLRNIEDRALGPCRLWSHRDRWIFHIYCKHRWLEGSGGRSIGLARELVSARRG